ncbi:hypothetical protein [Sulfurirhabdus autotrophica]|uniref:Uncharacterized protein n=1 Tax=Sulfurirhabdus autotrophica TaxID=1706046 RepID=A0A4R3YEZ2_9PROT|nr:hypothetical protein [Sulfurirhabdus autotrophica]TCV90660.1 hypothetical protein EDC63_101634 [Sulfurirhabdus autotrophica]
MLNGQIAQLWDFHLHNLIIKGISNPEISPYYEDTKNISARRFRRFNFWFANYRYDTIHRFPSETPYALQMGQLFYEGEPLKDLPFKILETHDDYWGSETSWWFKDIPVLGKYYDLRLNPINVCSNLKYKTGFSGELKGCVFCQRCYESPRKSENRTIVPIHEIFAEIFAEHGKDALEKITKILLITGDVQTEAGMLQLVEEIHHNHLAPANFKGTFSVVTTTIRSHEGIQRLSQIDNTLFEFPIECFTNRKTILGEAKGIPLEQVAEILSIARKYFKYIRVNYLFGLDDIESARKGFDFFAKNNLLDDVVSNIFVPYSEQAMQFRTPQSNAMHYIYEMRALIEQYGFSPKKTGTTKDAFSHFAKPFKADELVSLNQPRAQKIATCSSNTGHPPALPTTKTPYRINQHS